MSEKVALTKQDVKQPVKTGRWIFWLPASQVSPLVLPGSATVYQDKYQEFLAVKEYAKVAKKLAEEFNAVFIPLQAQFDAMWEKYGENTYFLRDGVHPNTAGAELIANAWLSAFENEIDK